MTETIRVTTLYGLNSEQPLVEIAMPKGEIVQMTPEQARDHAQAVFEAAEASETDGFLVEYFRSKRASDAVIAGIVADFRLHRDARRAAPA